MENSHAHEHHEHKAPNYYLVWVVLLVLTVAEVGVAFFSAMPKWLLIVLLLGLALWKAVLVALYYMHLKFEPKVLRLLTLAPVPLIFILLGAVLMEGF